jgi:hypothetical protein
MSSSWSWLRAKCHMGARWHSRECEGVVDIHSIGALPGARGVGTREDVTAIDLCSRSVLSKRRGARTRARVRHRLRSKRSGMWHFLKPEYIAAINVCLRGCHRGGVRRMRVEASHRPRSTRPLLRMRGVRSCACAPAIDLGPSEIGAAVQGSSTCLCVAIIDLASSRSPAGVQHIYARVEKNCSLPGARWRAIELLGLRTLLQSIN